jgi:hypothetical protein
MLAWILLELTQFLPSFFMLLWSIIFFQSHKQERKFDVDGVFSSIFDLTMHPPLTLAFFAKIIEFLKEKTSHSDC